jgi:phosphinothricin acetyltransferase
VSSGHAFLPDGTVRQGLDMVIRRPRGGDLDRIAEIYNDAVHAGVSTCDLSDTAPEDAAGWVEEHQGRFPLYVGEVGGEVAGWTCLSPFVDKACFDRTAYTSTYVGQGFQRRGIGRVLREHIIDEARELGFHSLVNRIFTRNTASVTLTEDLGFVRVGVLHEVIWRDGSYWDAALYELILDR